MRVFVNKMPRADNGRQGRKRAMHVCCYETTRSQMQQCVGAVNDAQSFAMPKASTRQQYAGGKDSESLPA